MSHGIEDDFQQPSGTFFVSGVPTREWQQEQMFAVSGAPYTPQNPQQPTNQQTQIQSSSGNAVLDSAAQKLSDAHTQFGGHPFTIDQIGWTAEEHVLATSAADKYHEQQLKNGEGSDPQHFDQNSGPPHVGGGGHHIRGGPRSFGPHIGGGIGPRMGGYGYSRSGQRYFYRPGFGWGWWGAGLLTNALYSTLNPINPFYYSPILY